MAADLKTINELQMMRHSIDAIRQGVNAELDGLAAQIEALLPEPEPVPAPRGKNYWKKEVAKW